MNDIKLENNQSVCIQKQNQITGTTYINVCNGDITFVRYGSGDLLLVVLLGSIILGMIFGFYKLIVMELF